MIAVAYPLVFIMTFMTVFPSRADGNEPSSTGRVWWVNQAHPDAGDAGSGQADRPFETISRAAYLAEPGDIVRVMAGVYRERVAPRRGGEPGKPIVYEAAPGQRVTIRASEPWSPDWQPIDGQSQLSRASLNRGWFDVDQAQAADWGEAFPKRLNPFVEPLTDASQVRSEAVDPYGKVIDATHARRVTRGQLFLNGEPMVQVASIDEAADVPGAWYAEPDGLSLIVHLPKGYDAHGQPNFEVTVRARCFAPYRRGLGYITVRGFVMEHGATDYHRGFYADRSPQAGILSTRGGHHWIIESNTIRFGNSLGLDIGTEGDTDADGLGQPEPETAGGHLIRFNTISDHGAGAIHGIRAPRSTISHNVIERNNRLGFSTPEIGAIKLHFFVDGRIENNLIRHNDAFGVWLDNVYHRAVVRRNIIISNAGAGIFLELGHGPLTVDHNIIAYTRFGPVAGKGDGVYAHDASGVTFAHNLVYANAGHGLYSHLATDRNPGFFLNGEDTGERKICEASGWRILGNVFIGNSLGSVALPPDTERSWDNHCDHNAYAGTLPLLTSETWAAAPGDTNFRILTNKARVELADVLPADELDSYVAHPFLTLDRWRRLTGRDIHSRHITVLRPSLDPQHLLLHLSVGPEFATIDAPRLEGVTADLRSRPLPHPARPGPVQGLTIDPRIGQPPGDPIPGRGRYDRVNNDYRNIVLLRPHLSSAHD